MKPIYTLICFTWLMGAVATAEPLLATQIPTDISLHAKPATIRVLLAKGVPQAIVEVRGRYHLYNLGDELLIHSSILGKRKIASAEGRESIKWGDLFQGISSLRLVPADAESTILVDGIQYRGCVELYNLQGFLHIVNEVDIESYLKATLALQFPSDTAPAVMDAAAIVARTDAYYHREHNPYALWHVAACESNYQGYALTFQNLCVDRAVENTSYAILTYEGAPFATSWTANSAGKTASFSSIFRKETASPAGVDAPLAAQERSKHKWSFAISKEELAQMAHVTDIQAVDLYIDPPSAKVYALKIKESRQTHSIDFFKLQQCLGKKLRSNDFSVQLSKDQIIFTGYGEGHGVGLCLYSAAIMAERGASASQILTTFFPKTKLEHRRTLEQK